MTGVTVTAQTSRSSKQPRNAQSVVHQRRSRMNDLKNAENSMSPRDANTAVPTNANNSLNFKNINDADQVALMNNSDKLATFNFMR